MDKIRVLILCLPFLFTSCGGGGGSTKSYEESLSDTYKHFNKVREVAGLIKLERNEFLEISAKNHSSYLVINNVSTHDEVKGKPKYTGDHPKDRAVHAGFLSLFVGEGWAVDSTPIDAVDSLMSAIYHRFGIFTLNKNIFGIGYVTKNMGQYNRTDYVHNTGNSYLNNLCNTNTYSSGRYFYEVCANSEHRIPSDAYYGAKNTVLSMNPRYVLWPAINTKNNETTFWGNETPNPLPDYEISGNPISVQFNQYYYKEKINVLSFKLFESKNNKEIKFTRLLSDLTDPNKHFNNYQYALFPLEPLNRSTEYKAEIIFTSGGIRDSISWYFQTGRD